MCSPVHHQVLSKSQSNQWWTCMCESDHRYLSAQENVKAPPSLPDLGQSSHISFPHIILPVLIFPVALLLKLQYVNTLCVYKGIQTSYWILWHMCSVAD